LHCDWLAKEVLGRLLGPPTIVLLHDFEWADETATVILDYLASDILAIHRQLSAKSL
jgi:hypothetical protein